VWVDGVHFNVRLEDDRLCTLVVIGVRADGTKELIVVEDGFRESAESWKTVLRDLKRRGMRPPVVAVGDGALGFWAAVRDVWPKTREQRDWFHNLGNILDKLPKRLQPRVRAALHEVMYAETRTQAREGVTRFASEYGAKYPKAVTTLEKDADMLLTFFDFPAAHWKHLRTSNVIESPFATVRLRQRVTKGCGVEGEGPLDGLQASGHGASPLATARRRASPPARVGRVHVRGRGAAHDQGPQAERTGRLNPLSRIRLRSRLLVRISRGFGRADRSVDPFAVCLRRRRVLGTLHGALQRLHVAADRVGSGA